MKESVPLTSLKQNLRHCLLSVSLMLEFGKVHLGVRCGVTLTVIGSPEALIK